MSWPTTVSEIRGEREIEAYLRGEIDAAELGRRWVRGMPWRIGADGKPQVIPAEEYQEMMRQRPDGITVAAAPAEKPCSDAELAGLYAQALIDARANGPEALRVLANQTAALLARQTGWTKCQRAARQRALVAQWMGARKQPQKQEARAAQKVSQPKTAQAKKVEGGETTAPAAAPRLQVRDPLQPAPVVAAYMPFSPVGDLGAEYNRIMQRLAPGEWALFVDHDAMMLTNDVWPDLLTAIAQHPDAGAVVCFTNRTGNARQKIDAPDGDDISTHAEFARDLREKRGFSLTRVTGEEMTGVWFATNRDAWEKTGGFVHGFGEVDNAYARALKRCGLETWRLDGIYVYHQRRTNGWKGAVATDFDCWKTGWLWAKANPMMASRAHGAVADAYRVHVSAVETRTDVDEHAKGMLRKAVLERWKKTMRVSVVIPSREEPPDELAGTVAAFKAGGAAEVIVVDDGSTVHPVSESCGADAVLKNDVPSGVAFSRNRGLAAASGDVIGFSDSHCRIAEGFGTFSDWAFEAWLSADLLCAVCGSYDNPETWYWGCQLRWKEWRFDVNAYRAKNFAPEAPFGSVYCAARSTWDRIGGWMPTRGWGYNEQALGLACHHADVPIRVEPWFRIRHKFRNDRKFPFALSGLDSTSNAPWVHRLIFGERLYRWFFRPAMESAGQSECLARAERWAAEDGGATMARYESLRCLTPEHIMRRIGNDGLVPPFPTEVP